MPFAGSLKNANLRMVWRESNKDELLFSCRCAFDRALGSARNALRLRKISLRQIGRVFFALYGTTAQAVAVSMSEIVIFRQLTHSPGRRQTFVIRVSWAAESSSG
jgi:hypothetical protein